MAGSSARVDRVVEPVERPAADEAVRVSPLARVSSSFIYLILAGLIVAFALLQGTRFLDLKNFQNIALYTSTLMLLVVGSTFVIITGGVDLSVGAVLVFASVVAAKSMVWISLGGQEAKLREYPNVAIGIPVGILLGVLAGLAWGVLNGVLVTRLKMPSFIVTLGTLGMALGLSYILSGGVNVPFVPPAVQKEIGTRSLFTLSLGDQSFRLQVPVAAAAVVVAIAAIALSRTRFGRYTYAIGSNADAARRAGVDVNAHLVKVYGLSGLLAGLAGGIDVAIFNTASVGSHQADNLKAISAVVIGGTSLFGGIGTIGGSVVGAFIPEVLKTGFVIQGIDPFWQQVAIGAILIIAVYLDQRRRQAEERR